MKRYKLMFLESERWTAVTSWLVIKYVATNWGYFLPFTFFERKKKLYVYDESDSVLEEVNEELKGEWIDQLKVDFLKKKN